MPRTPDEIAELKRQWVEDPCWDIEDTEGFEDHHDELAAYASEYRDHQESKRLDHLSAKAETLGCPGNIKLAEYVMRLEGQLERLEEFCGKDHYEPLEEYIEGRITARISKFNR